MRQLICYPPPEEMTARYNDTYSSPSSKQSRYRPEIDGLRAFAVVAVIINHFNKDILPGGYLGVDIFFVISGYVITSSLFGRPSKDFKDFISGFYERRIKRLVPALSIFVVIMSIAVCLFNPAPGISLRTGLTSLFGFSNVYLLMQSTDYFGQSTELNVFTHTWSLGVEEQFYILFPFLIWFSGFGRQAKNGARNLFFAVGALTIASLVGFVYLYPTNQPAAYFLMPSRFWEMAAGCLIFIGFQKRASVEQLLEKVPPLLVIALIVGVMYLPMSMASASTVAVVALSSILIASLKKPTAAFKVFTNPKVVYIGLISYSLYLWHWGVLSISRWTIGIHWWSVPFQVALMLGLAVASYRWIEAPLRKGNWFGKRWKTLIIGVVILLFSSLIPLLLGISLKKHLFAGGVRNEVQKDPWTNPWANGAQCLQKLSSNTFCYFVDNKHDRTLWVVGDSHSKPLGLAAEKVSNSNYFNLKLFANGGTPFPPVSQNSRAFDRNHQRSLHDYELLEHSIIQNLRRGDVVLIAMRFPYHFGGTYYEHPPFNMAGSVDSQKDFFINWISSLQTFSSIARERGATVIIHTPTPEWEKQLNNQCSSNRYWFNLPMKEYGCQINKTFFTDVSTGIYRHLFHVLTQIDRDNESIVLLDMFSVVCPDDVCKFFDTARGIDIYEDDDHLSAMWLEDKVAPELESLILGIK